LKWLGVVVLDFESLAALRKHHPAWRLLRSDHAELIASFLFKAFIQTNLRVISALELTEGLEDHLYALRQVQGGESYPRSAAEYLNDWAEPEKGWLRKFYRAGTDEAQFDLTPATEKALSWLEQLTARTFVGTESRLLMLFELLRQISEGSEQDPVKRLEELEKKKREIEAEMTQIARGELALLNDTAIRDRFQQFSQIARELLADFREVEHNFRQLDRRVREKIALWDGSKGELIGEVMGARDAIGDSDQGRSFGAFWEFLLSSRRQEELSLLLEKVLGLEAVLELRPDARMRRVHHDWLEAGEHTQRTVAQLSQQLRRFLDDQAFLENRRIMELIRGIEVNALNLRNEKFPAGFMEIDEASPQIDLPMERPLNTPSGKSRIQMDRIEIGQADFDTALLFDQIRIDKTRLNRHIQNTLRRHDEASLMQLIEQQPLEQGLPELMAYLQLGTEAYRIKSDPEIEDTITWQAHDREGRPVQRKATMPRIVFTR
jgi:Protein of unknown function (DUF3375)